MVAEMGDEMPDGLALDVGQMAVIVLDALEVGDIGEQVLRVHEELVHVVEIRQDDFAPEDELVQGLRLRVDRLVRLVQLQQQPDAVRHFPAVYPAEKVIDGQ